MSSRTSQTALMRALRAYQGIAHRQSQWSTHDAGSAARVWESLAAQGPRGLLNGTAHPWRSPLASLRPRATRFEALVNNRQSFHTSVWYLQQRAQQPQAAKSTSGSVGHPTLTVSGAELQARSAQTIPQVADFADAEECDEAIEDLELARKRVRALNRPPPGHVSLSQRARQIVSATTRGSRVAVDLIVSIPGRVQRFVLLPRAERRATYARWWAVVKKEAKHYWLGTKLLGKDIKIASRLATKVLQGRALSRRERQQLTRTMADIFRLVPMLVFVIVPFMELLLPVALKLFPNMLPSTFEDKLKREEEMKRRISARLEVARFLQDTVAEMASDMTAQRSGDTKTSAAELYQFMKRVRAGDAVAPSELLKFAKLFNDELTLDNLERVQLVSLCRFVGLAPFGTDAFLRARLRSHLQQIKEDDRDIQEEGLDSLTEDELRHACRARGMRAPFGEGAAVFMREQLAEWLDWSLNRSLPSSLLLLSRAFMVTAPIGKAKAPVTDVLSLRETLSSLPDEAVEDVELFATASDGDKTTAYERKLDLLEREEELIKEEEEAAVATELPVTAGRATAQELAATAAAAAVVREAAAESLIDILDESESQEERASKQAAAKQARMRQVLHALAALVTSSGVTAEREAFMDLVQNEIDRLNSSLGSRGVGMVFTRGHLEVDRARLEQALGQKRLEERVTGILKRVEKELDVADSKIGSKLRVLDLDNDGVVSQDELRSAMRFLRQQMGEEDLRAMLEALAEEAPADRAGGGINVAKLMELALQQSNERDDE